MLSIYGVQVLASAYLKIYFCRDLSISIITTTMVRTRSIVEVVGDGDVLLAVLLGRYKIDRAG